MSDWLTDEGYLVGNYDASRTIFKQMIRIIRSGHTTNVKYADLIQLVSEQYGHSEGCLMRFYEEGFDASSSSNV